MPKAKKNLADIQRAAYFRGLALKWLQLRRPDVLDACRKAAEAKFPKSTKSRSKIDLTKELEALK